MKKFFTGVLFEVAMTVIFIGILLMFAYTRIVAFIFKEQYNFQFNEPVILGIVCIVVGIIVLLIKVIGTLVDERNSLGTIQKIIEDNDVTEINCSSFNEIEIVKNNDKEKD